MNSLQVTSITPLEKRPLHPKAARARGLSEASETVFVIEGLSDGHIHSPIEHQGRSFRPFDRHESSKKPLTIVQVLRDNPKNPLKGGEVAKYTAGILTVYENATRVRRPQAGTENGRPVWQTRKLEITMVEPLSGKETRILLIDALAWRSGSEPSQAQPGAMTPFCVKAVELTPKEIEAHKAHRKQHERVKL